MEYNISDVCFVEVLPLVEFFLEDDISDEEAMQLLESELPRRKQDTRQDGWRQETNARILYNVIYVASERRQACVNNNNKA